MTTAGNFKKDWEAAKKKFETDSGRKKPAESYMLLFRKSSGVSKVMQNLDKAGTLVSRATGAKRQDALRVYETAVTQADTVCDRYMEQLFKESVKQTKAAKTPDEKKNAKALDGYLETLSGDLEGIVDAAKADLNMSKAMTNAQGDLDIQKAKGKDVYLAVIPKVCKAGVRWTLNQTKAPNPKTFNAGVQKVCRDITQNTVNLQRLEPKGSQKYRELEELNKLLVAYGNEGMQVEDDRADKVIVALSHLQKNIVAVNAWCMNNK